MKDGLFDYLPTEKIREAFARAPGNEIELGKLENPRSSAALAANTFGYFLERPGDLPMIPGTEGCGWPAQRVALEYEARFPWSGGTHPWLDALVETGSHMIGIESKRYEPFGGKASGAFSKAYWKEGAWGERMGPFERMRDALHGGERKFERLDAFQLVKHALGLRTQAGKTGKAPVLLYLFAEPWQWPDGRPVDAEAIKVHADEAERFTSEVAGAEVAFVACTYDDLLLAFAGSPSVEVRNHGTNIELGFRP